MIAHGKKIKIFTGNSHPELAKEIADLLGLPLGNAKVSTFSDGEIRIYMFLAIFVGCILYMLLISRYFININVQIVFYLKKIIGKIFTIVFWPIRLLLKPIHFVTINLKKFTKEQYKNTKKIIKHQNDKIKA